MKITFFEEFPTSSNLKKLSLVDWQTKLYLAAHSHSEFIQLKKKVQKTKNNLEVIYWPILDKKEGYWFSPFSERKALLKNFQELEHQKTPVMLDLELPTTKNPKLYLTQAFNFFRNKKLINHFIQNYPSQVYLAEYYPDNKDKWMEWIGLHYNIKQANIIKMLYHSMHHFQEDFVRKELKRGLGKWGDHFIIAYGTIAHGTQGNELILTIEQLKKDLEMAKETKVKEVVIFRLGGLNKEIAEVLKDYSK